MIFHILFRVSNPTMAMNNVEDFRHSTHLLAATTLRWEFNLFLLTFFYWHFFIDIFAKWNYLSICGSSQGTKARNVISEVYAFFVLQCTVFGRKSKHKMDSTAWHGIHFHKNNLWNILVIENCYVNNQNYQN